MTQLVLWIIVALSASLVLASRLRLLIAFSLALFILVPAVAAQLFVGSPGGIPTVHPGGWVALVGVFVQVLLRLEESARLALQHKLLSGAVAMMTTAALLFTVTASGAANLGLIINQVIAPFALFILVRIELGRRSSSGPFLARVVVGLGAIQAVISIGAWLQILPQPFDSQLKSYSWYVPGDFVRAIGTTDHPLALATLLVLCIALLPSLRSAALQVVFGISFLATIFLCESRTGLLLGAVGLLLILMRRGASLGARLAALGALAGALVVYVSSTVSDGLAEKLVDDTGSAGARGLAIRAVLENWQDFALTGRGTGSNYQTARDLGLRTSFENPFMMYMVDFGLIATVVYFGALAIAVLRPGTRATPGGRAAGLLVLAAVQTYSSVGSNSAVGAVMWLAIAFATRETRAGDEAAIDELSGQFRTGRNRADQQPYTNTRRQPKRSRSAQQAPPAQTGRRP